MKLGKMFGALCRLHSNERGLTAIELAVVVAILAVLAGLVAGNTTGMSNAARGSAQSTDVAEVQKAVDNYVGQHPNAEYPVGGSAVACATGQPISPTVTLSPKTLAGLQADLDTDQCASLSVDAYFTTPDTPPVTKTFVSDFMQRNPKHVTDSPNTWVIDEEGKVYNKLSKDAY